MVEEFEGFKMRWLEKAEEIKKDKLEPRQCFYIMNDFIDEGFFYRRDNEIKLDELRSDVDLACQFAISNERNEKLKYKPSWSITFLGNGVSFKMPDFKNK